MTDRDRSLPSGALPVLDKGYVALVDVMGDDLKIVNAARASFQKRASWLYRCDECGHLSQRIERCDACQALDAPRTPTLAPRDVKLLAYLARNREFSPFRHATLTFEVKAPLLVARQWWKYVVGSDHTMDAWNEASRRYVTLEPEFYIPDVWRGAPANGKQGSAGEVDFATAERLHATLVASIECATDDYQWALAQGVAPEQARLLLPMWGLYTVWYWTASLQSVGHFLAERLDAHAQWEIRQYADAVRQLAEPRFPVSLPLLLQHDRPVLAKTVDDAAL